jgi:HAD superfamily hydrolase (TIGR01549 family)
MTRKTTSSVARRSSAPFAYVETVYLDLDGTLVDALAGWHAGFAAVWPSLLELAPDLAHAGTSRQVYDGRVRVYMHEAHEQSGGGEWSDDFVRAAFRRLVAEHASAHAHSTDTIADRYIRLSAERAPLYPDARTAIDRIGSRVRLGVITNGLERDQRLKVGRIVLGEAFAAVVISEAVGLRKPDPAIFEHALALAGARRETALYVGDNPQHDVAGAHAAGMAAVWLNRGDGFFGTTSDAEASITRLDELPGLLGLD